MPTSIEPQWRAAATFTPRSASKTGLLEETRAFLLAYAQFHDLVQVREALHHGGLIQRSRETRRTILTIIQLRLTYWNPPAWVLNDLVAFAQADDAQFASVLLLHTVRQDALLGTVVNDIIVPRWAARETAISRVDVQELLDAHLPQHPEVARWSVTTRQKIASNALAILGDFGLLTRTPQRRITEPLVLPPVANHLVRLLIDEGIAPDALATHPDWQIWLWDARRAQAAVDAVLAAEATI